MADIADGESIEVKGSAAKPYLLTNTGGVYSCTCPAWRNQSLPIEKRTCKHLRKVRGDEAEKERTGGALPQRAKKSKSASDGPPILLAQKWDNAQDLTDWWISEKLDGVRAYWDGKRFLSRQGNVYHAPSWFIKDLPDCPLDGELWIDRQAFQRTISIVRRQDKSDHWKDVRYVIFDAPKSAKDFESRIEFLRDAFPKSKGKSGYATVLEQQLCKSVKHLQKELARVESLGGEGLMLREPGSAYEIGRSMSLLKVKSFHDAEAIVIGHQPGRGKHKGKMGAIEVQLPDGTEFKVGTGFSDKQRSEPPEIGSVVTFRYQELTDGGVPRFPSFVRLQSGKSTAYEAGTTKAKRSSSPKKSRAKEKKAQAKATSPTDKRYFEFVDDKSSKFWEVFVDGATFVTRYGRIGADGQTKEKEFADNDAAMAHAEKQIAKKTGAGYEEK